MPKKYLRVSALILPHEREAYAAYRMQPKRESCAALYQALRENMATLEQAAKNPEFSPQKRTSGHRCPFVSGAFGRVPGRDQLCVPGAL